MVQMIRSIRGTVISAQNGYITVEVCGIGYLVATPTNTGISYEVGDSVQLHTYLAVRENALDLYGFQTQAELELFELLLQVPKIGPKSALQVLNQATPDLLVEAIGKKDAQYLHKLSGIGKKTGENIVQYLHDKLEGFSFAGVVVESEFSDAQGDAIDALVSLGYDLATARETIRRLDPKSTTNELVSQALKNI